jgi:hypothetical protein
MGLKGWSKGNLIVFALGTNRYLYPGVRRNHSQREILTHAIVPFVLSWWFILPYRGIPLMSVIAYSSLLFILVLHGLHVVYIHIYVTYYPL